MSNWDMRLNFWLKFYFPAHHEHHQHQLDNNLPPYQSKIARLNVECADPSLLQDCIAGQKWKCINEDGRWRKHKCKFHREVQTHLAEVTKLISAQTKRNCACFTPDGIVYTKIKSERDVFQPKQKRFEAKQRKHNSRHKRETAVVDEIYIDQVPPEFIDLLKMDEVVGNLQNSLLNQTQPTLEGSRKKRDVDYMTQTIDELDAVLATIEKKYANGTGGPAHQCFVETTGKVNCSTTVYENEAAWKQSCVQVDMLIKVLKKKILNLKDIKKHLREHRPMNMTYDEENYENSSLSLEDLVHSEELEEATQAPRKRQQSSTVHPHRHQPAAERRKKQKASTTTTEAVFSSFTTENDDIFSSSVTEDTVTEESSTSSSTMEATSSTASQKLRIRTKVPRTTTKIITTTTTFEPPVYEDYSFGSDTLENSSSMSPLPDFTETPKAIVVTENFDSKSVTIDATIIEPKHRHRQPSNNFNMNITTEHDHLNRNVAADCYCEPEHERLADEATQNIKYFKSFFLIFSPPSFEKEIAKDARKKLKEERQRKKERKRHKKAKMEKECLTEKMNCFSHDKDHWRTEPVWDDKPFCFCMNANNNTYSCLRTINQTHNYLYCEFTTGLITFYNLKKGT